MILKHSKMMELEDNKKNHTIIINLISTVILQIISIISAPLFSRLLGTSNYGIVASYAVWVSIISMLFTLKGGGAVALARSKFPLCEQKKYQSSVLSLSLCSFLGFSIILCILLICFKHFFEINTTIVFIALIHGLGSYIVSFESDINIYELRAKRNLVLNLTQSILTLLLSCILITALPTTVNYYGRIIGQAVVLFGLAIFIMLKVFIKGRRFYDARFWGFTLPLTIPMVVQGLAADILSQSDRVMIQFMRNNSEVGIYSLAASFSGTIYLLWGALNNSWLAFYYDYYRLDKIYEIYKSAKNYIELFTVLTCGFILLSKEVYQVFADPSFWLGTDIIPLYALGNYFVFLNSFPYNYNFYNKKTFQLAFVTVSSAGLNLVLNWFLIAKWGMFGAVVSTVVSYFYQFIANQLYANFYAKCEYHFSSIKLFIPTCAVFVSIGLSLSGINGLIRWGIGAMIGVAELYRIVKRQTIF